MALYRYYKCAVQPNTHARQAEQIFGSAGKPKCCGQNMVEFGRGDAPFPPVDLPGTYMADLNNLLTGMTVDEMVDSGTAYHQTTGKTVSYIVKKNRARDLITVDVKVDTAASVYASFFISQLQSAVGVLPKDQWIKPAFQLNGYGASSVVVQYNELTNIPSSVLSNPPPMPKPFKVGVRLGNVFFGLIHTMAGHYKDFSAAKADYKIPSFTAPTPTVRDLTPDRLALFQQTGGGVYTIDAIRQLPYVEQMKVLQAIGDSENLFEESRRWSQAFCTVLQTVFGLANIQAVFQDAGNSDRWMLVGHWPQRGALLQLVVQNDGGMHSIITMYKTTGTTAPTIPSRYKVAWKRSNALLPTSFL